MPAIITSAFRKANATLLLNSANTSGLYWVGVGKTDVWPDVAGLSESTANFPVGIPTDSVKTVQDALDNLIALKKVESSDAALVVPRNEWVSGRRYKIFDTNDPLCFDIETIGGITYYPCYVSKGGYVYIALKAGGASTSLSPSYVDFSSGVLNNSLSDGYIWALCQESNVNSPFYSDQFIQVATDLSGGDLTDATAATGGLLYGFKIVSGGSSVTSVKLQATNVAGNFTELDLFSSGVSQQAGITVTVVSGVVTSIVADPTNANFTTARKLLDLVRASVTTNNNSATIIPLIAPLAGFGASPAADLPSFYVGIAKDFITTESGDAMTDVGFRQISLVYNPTTANNGDSPATPSSADSLRYFNIASGTTVPSSGSIITQNNTGAKAFIDKIVDPGVGQPKKIFFHQNSSPLINHLNFSTNVANQIKVDTGSLFAFVTIENAEYTRNTGKVLFIENRKPIVRTTDQTEKIRLVIQM